MMDVKEQAANLKWKMAVHNMEKMEQANSRIETIDRKMTQTKTKKHWKDDLKKIAGLELITKSQNREKWRKEADAYVRQLMEDG